MAQTQTLRFVHGFTPLKLWIYLKMSWVVRIIPAWVERWEHLAGTLATCRWVPLPPTVRCHCRVPVCVEQQQPDSRPWARSTLSLWSVFTNHPGSSTLRARQRCFSEKVLKSAPAMIRGWEREWQWDSRFSLWSAAPTLLLLRPNR